MNQELLMKAVPEHPALSAKTGGLTQWRVKQRSLPVGEKMELIGRFIQETRHLETIKKSCKQSVTSSNNSSAKGH